MSKDIAIDKASAPGRMAAIRSETESLLAEMEGGYGELLGSISHSKGDFIDALKVQINSELEMVRGACDFFLTLLQMMQAADTDFGTLDDAYSKEKIK
ncbi:MAG: hypothetical protein HDR23_06895 [Lachnospiraceae bacterium]|nr:hypothetical protein [Lachnospiraceae bacterium]